MEHELASLAQSIYGTLKQFVVYFADMLKNLRWTQVFLVFILLFFKQVRDILRTLNKLLGKIKNFKWAGVEGEIEKVSESVQEAEETAETPIIPTLESKRTMLQNIVRSKKPAQAKRDSDFEAYRHATSNFNRLLAAAHDRPHQTPADRFLEISREIENTVKQTFFLYGLQQQNSKEVALSRMTRDLLKAGVISEETINSINSYRRLRNKIIHSGTSEQELLGASLLGTRLVSLLKSIPRPEYFVIEPRLTTSTNEDLTQPEPGIFAAILQNKSSGYSTAFLTTTSLERGTTIVPMTTLNDRLRGDFFYRYDNGTQKITGSGYDLEVLYSRV